MRTSLAIRDPRGRVASGKRASADTRNTCTIPAASTPTGCHHATLLLGSCRRMGSLAALVPVQQPLRRGVQARGLFGSSTSQASVEEDTTGKWWLQGKGLWTEVKTLADFDHEVNHADRMVVVDWYATWCHGCERSFPEVTKIIQDPELQKTFKFVKVCVENMQSFARAEGITALPRVSVYRPGEGRLVTIDVPFSRVKHLKTNLLVIKGNPGKSYTLDPNGFVIPVAKAAAVQEKEDKAAAVAALSTSNSGLFEHLMAVANGKKAAANPNAAKAAAPPPSPTPSPSPAAPSVAPAPSSSSVPGVQGGPTSLSQVAEAEAARWPESLGLGHMYHLDKQSFLVRYGRQYGYGGRIDQLYPREVGGRLKPNEHYLDYTGSSVYCRSQLDAVFAELQATMFGNPHSANPSSQLTSGMIDDIRLQLLNFFNADPREYQVIFTKSATGALKLLGETFPWTQGSTFRYLRENHNSVLGIREYALKNGGHFEAVTEQTVEQWISSSEPEPAASSSEPTLSLFAFPAEDNFAGVKYPLRWVKAVQAKSTPQHQWRVLVDAAAYAATQPLDLTQCPADFVDVAFYKMFGYPTGLGALLVRTEAAASLRKVFWGGGTVALATASDNFHVLKCKPSDKFEEGTVAFLDIIALKHGLNMVEGLGGMKSIQAHTDALASWTFERLSALKHSNGKPMVAIFGKHHMPDSAQVQGPIINFEVLQPNGNVFSYKTFEREAAQAGFHVRTGTECNPGACYAYLGVKEEEIETLVGKKEGCDDDVEWLTVQRPQGAKPVIRSSDILQSISSKAVGLGHPAEVAMKWVEVPLGSVRISLGYMSTFEDCWAFVNFVASRYKDREMPVAEPATVAVAE